MSASLIAWLWDLSIAEVSVFFTLLNIGIFLSSIFLCWAVGRVFAHRRLFETRQRLPAAELLAAVAAVLLDSLISVVGCWPISPSMCSSEPSAIAVWSRCLAAYGPCQAWIYSARAPSTPSTTTLRRTISASTR